MPCGAPGPRTVPFSSPWLWLPGGSPGRAGAASHSSLAPGAWHRASTVATERVGPHLAVGPPLPAACCSPWAEQEPAGSCPASLTTHSRENVPFLGNKEGENRRQGPLPARCGTTPRTDRLPAPTLPVVTAGTRSAFVRGWGQAEAGTQEHVPERAICGPSPQAWHRLGCGSVCGLETRVASPCGLRGPSG